MVIQAEIEAMLKRIQNIAATHPSEGVVDIADNISYTLRWVLTDHPAMYAFANTHAADEHTAETAVEKARLRLQLFEASFEELMAELAKRHESQGQPQTVSRGISPE